MSKDYKDLLVALDIGTSKVVAIVAELKGEGHYEVIGLGQSESKGLKKGVVVNIEATVQSIQRALEEAELMADCKITNVFTGIAGSHIRSFNSSGMVAIKEKEVTQADVARVIETAKAINIPTDQQVLHILTQEFIIDGQEDVREPIGMSGIRLEVKVHIVTGAVSAAQNIVKCVRRCGLEVNDLILQPLASSLAVLTEDEKELGVVLVDIGGGTTDIAVISLSGIVYSRSVRVAGNALDDAVMLYLKRKYNLLIGERTAETIKMDVGSAYPLDKPLTMDIKGRNLIEGVPKTITICDEEIREALSESIATIINGIRVALERTPPELSADISDRGIVLTGGGALIKNLDKRIREETGLPVSIADDPLASVVLGTGKMLSDFKLLRKISID
jgi:cell division protein FtsA